MPPQHQNVLLFLPSLSPNLRNLNRPPRQSHNPPTIIPRLHSPRDTSPLDNPPPLNPSTTIPPPRSSHPHKPNPPANRLFRPPPRRFVHNSPPPSQIPQYLSSTVQGTRTLLQAATNLGVKTILLTSCTHALTAKSVPDPVLNENSWSDLEFVRSTSTQLPYGPVRLAKTLQERAAWELAAKRGFKLITLHPCTPIGPALTTTSAMDFLIQLARGNGLPHHPCTRRVPDAFVAIVDVRDVAHAHVLALEGGEANGRYLLIAHLVHCERVVQRLRECSRRFRELPVFRVDSPDGKMHAVPPYEFDNSKVRALGVVLRPWEESVGEAARALEHRL